MKRTGIELALIGALLGSALSGCVPVMVTGAAVVAVSSVDRRSAGTQLEDQSLQIRANQRIKEVLPGTDEAYANVNVYNRKILLTGLAPDARAKARAEQLVAAMDNVRGVHNELRVGAPVAGASSARDTVTSTRLRAALFDDKEVESNAVKVVTEARTVYLMGLVTRAEGEHIARVASRISGVDRVVTFWEPLSEQELAAIHRERAKAPSNTAPAN